MKSLLDRSFVYIPAAQTDLKARFDKELRRIRAEQKAQAAERLQKVIGQIKEKKTA